MKLRIERERLLEALTTVSHAVARTGTGPDASGIRVKTKAERAQLFATGPDLSIEERVDIDAGADGTAVLPARLTHDIVRALPPGSDVDVVVSGAEAEITAGRSHFTVRTLRIEDFPEPPKTPSTSATFETAAFVGALRQVVPAAMKADHPVLTGVLFAASEAGLRLVATDTYRLALRDLPGSSVLAANQEVILPASALAQARTLMSGVESASLRLGEVSAAFDIGSVRLTTRLIAGSFPPYEKMLPGQRPHRLEVAKGELMDALDRVKLMCPTPGDALAMELSATSLRLQTVGTSENGTAGEDLEGTYDGPAMTVGVRPDFLRAAVDAVDGDRVAVSFGDGPLDVLVVEAPASAGETPLQRTLVMPTRLG